MSLLRVTMSVANEPQNPPNVASQRSVGVPDGSALERVLKDKLLKRQNNAGKSFTSYKKSRNGVNNN